MNAVAYVGVPAAGERRRFLREQHAQAAANREKKNYAEKGAT